MPSKVEVAAAVEPDMFWPDSRQPWPQRLPVRHGAPIRIQFRRTVADPSGKPAHAATFLRERRIVLEKRLRRARHELARIFVHELFHFAWLRLSNAKRRSYEELISGELRRGARGELGWSAEWRKRKLTPRDRTRRTRRWRDYCCESFCDTAAWRYAGAGNHDEFTLGASERPRRRGWFDAAASDGGFSI